MKRSHCAAVSLATTLLAGAAAAAPHGKSPTEAFRLADTVAFEGKAPSWDYVTFDTASGRLFLGRRADGVTVYDTRARRVLKTLDDSQKANGAALAPEFDRGYTANGDGTSTAFQLSTLRTLGRIKLGESADGAYYDPASGKIAITRGDDHLITFIDARSGKVDGDLKTESGELEGVAADGHGAMFVSERDKNRVAKFDPVQRRLLAEWPTGPGCVQPTGLAIDRISHRLFVGCKGDAARLTVMDSSNGAVVASLPIGRGNDGVVWDAAGKRVFASGGLDANIVVYDQAGPDSYRLDQAFTTRPIARTMAYDPATRTVYTVAAEGMVDPGRPVNTRAGAFYPNAYFDNSYKLFIYKPQPFTAAPPAED